MISSINHTRVLRSSQNRSDCRVTFIDGNYFRVYLLPSGCSWMATEMAEVSNRVNFGSWTGRLTCPEKSGQREYPMISGLVQKKKVWNSVSGKYRTGLHLMMLNEHIHLHFVVRLCGGIPRNRDITSWGSIPKSLEWHSLILIKMVCNAPVQCNLKKHSAIYFEKTWMRKWGIGWFPNPVYAPPLQESITLPVQPNSMKW